VKLVDGSPVPWRIGHLVVVYVVNLTGLLLIVVAWIEVSGQLTLRAQIPWVDVGVAGIIVAGAGNVLWMLTGRRAVGEMRRGLTVHLPAAGQATFEDDGLPRAASDQFVAGRRMSHYHRAECPLVEGKRVTLDSHEGHLSAARVACDVCIPSAVPAGR
jgi:hypothetical protein